MTTVICVRGNLKETRHCTLHIQHGKSLQREQSQSHQRRQSSWMWRMLGQKVWSTRHNTVRHDGQLVTLFYGATSWPCDELTGSRSRPQVLALAWEGTGTFCARDLSFPRTNSPYGELSFQRRSRELSFPGPFVPRNFRSQDFSFPGTFVPPTILQGIDYERRQL